MAKTISQRITLEGSEDIRKALEELGKTGEEAFKKLQDEAKKPITDPQQFARTQKAVDDLGQSATRLSQQFSALATADGGAAKSINQVGEAADKTAGSFSRISLESVKTGAEIAKIGAEIAKVGVEIVVAARSHESLIGALVRLAGTASTAVRALSFMGPAIGAVGAAIVTTGGVLAGGVIALELLEKAATKFAASHEKVTQALQTLAVTAGQSFESLQQGEAAFNQIGISAETFRSTIAKLSETLASTDIGAEKLKDGMRDILRLVNEIAAGEKDVKFASWVTGEQKIKAVAIALKDAEAAGKDAIAVLLQFIRNADLATALKIGAAFGLTEADVDRVRRYGNGLENISDLYNRIKATGALISPAAAASFDKMRTSVLAVDSAWSRLKQSLASTLFTGLAASFSSAMNNLEASAVNTAARIIESFNAIANEAIRVGGVIRTNVGVALEQVAQRIGALDLFRGIGEKLRQSIQGWEAMIAAFVGGVMRGMTGVFSEAQIIAVQNAIRGIKTEAEAAGQAVQRAGATFTVFGTVAAQGANTARAAVEETTRGFTVFGTVASQAGDAAAQSAAQGAQAYAQVTTQIQAAAGQAEAFNATQGQVKWDAVAAGISVWDSLTSAIGKAVDRLLQFLRQVGTSPGGAPTGAAPQGYARGGHVGGRGSGTSDSNLAWVSRGEHIMPARVVRQPGVLALLESLRRSGRIPGFAGGGLVEGLSHAVIAPVFNAVIDMLNGLVQAIARTMGNHDRAMEDIVSSIIETANTLQQLNPGRHAHGGLLGGRGSGTSDSNLAWVSRGEYITPARAVRQPGVLLFLEALRRSGGNLRRVLDGMGHFALGGLVPSMPAFANLGNGMSNVTIQFPGLPAIGGLRAPGDVVEELRKAAAMAQVRSGGRKPSRYS